METHSVGSHVHLRHPANGRKTQVAMHRRDLPRPTLRAILRQAGLTEDAFRELL